MSFNSFAFLVFLPIVFCLYWFFCQRNLKLQNLLVVIASYIFYGWWDWRFLILIAFTTACSFFLGLATRRCMENDEQKKGKRITIYNIVINLGILGIFKYYNFFAESLRLALIQLGVELDIATLELVLPVGISFYTFQALSYTIDVYRHKIQATNDIISFFAFISFFPQLVAGPIERATNLLPQFQRKRVFSYQTAVDGTRQILWGLFKKVVVADNCADVVDMVWSNYGDYSTTMLIVAAFLFCFQIYGDFSGYSDIAIGTAKLFGIRLMRNFNLPYLSRSVAEFWKRWHISLNTWFVDYVYIPLGGSRNGQWKTIRNTFVIFFLSGLWHGANWTYVTWGVYHAALFIPLVLVGGRKKYDDVVAQNRHYPSLREVFQVVLTFIFVGFGWIIFRAKSIGEFFDYIYYLFVNYTVDSPLEGKKALLFVFLLIIIEWFNRAKEHAFDFTINSRLVRWGIYLLFALLCLSQSGKQVQFIYFQF